MFLSVHPSIISNRDSATTFEEVQFFNGDNYLQGLDWLVVCLSACLYACLSVCVSAGLSRVVSGQLTKSPAGWLPKNWDQLCKPNAARNRVWDNFTV